MQLAKGKNTCVKLSHVQWLEAMNLARLVAKQGKRLQNMAVFVIDNWVIVHSPDNEQPSPTKRETR